MSRIAIVGANGQVGTEVSVRLSSMPDITVAPVCRNRLGSAFLRYTGLACRHGRIAVSAEAPGLIRDCDVVANFALGAGSPREAHEQNARIISNTVQYARPGATVILFSTVSVYGDATGGVHKHSAYAKEKLACERLAVKLGESHNRRVIVLRLGQVTGDWQGISLALRGAIRRGPLLVPFPERASNTTHTVAICDAIVACANGTVPAGVYDLYNTPHWSWRQVVEQEAATVGQVARMETIPEPEPVPVTIRSRVLGQAVRVVSVSAGHKERLMGVLTRFSPSLNARAQAVYRQARARREIAELSNSTLVTDALKWNPVGTNPLRGLTPTADLLAAGRFAIASETHHAWAADMPLAASAQ